MRAPKRVSNATFLPRFAAAAALVALAGCSMGREAAWTGTWAVSPQAGGAAFGGGQTLRQIVHTSIGGAVARVRFSNAFGDRPLVVSDVHVARRGAGGGSTIDGATDRALTFAGATSVTIAGGDAAVSDRIDFEVPALADVVVSAFLPQPTGAATWHELGGQTNYVAAGASSASAAPALTGAEPRTSYFFLTSLDVFGAAADGALVALGASITDGAASALDTNRRWPNDLAARLAAAGRAVGVLNQGISGNRLLADGAGPSALARFDRDVLGQAGVRWVIFSDDPINDLGVGGASGMPSGDALVAGLRQLVERAHAGGMRFLCSTLTPFEGASYWTPQGEAGRATFNAFVRGAASGCDALVDQDAATHDPARPTAFLPAYDSGDHLHPNEAGLQAIAGAVGLGAL